MREKAIYVLGILGTALLVFNFYRIFLVIPIDALQGAIYRIIFIHVPAAITADAFYAVAVIASIAFLIRKNFAWDSLAVSAVEVWTMFTLVNLATGSIWGRVEWGIWWAWDARLTTTLLLWLIYVSYLLTRRFAAGPQMRTSSAVLGIFGGIAVPIVYIANRIPGQHPGPVFGGDRASGMAPEILRPFLWNMVAWLFWGVLVLILRHQYELKQQAAAALEAEQSLNA